MTTGLIIVESPAKAKTIEKYLGNKYKVLATYGHIKDLPASKLGVDIEHSFTPTYQLLPKAKKVIEEVKKAAKNADAIYIASDPDREGEAIAFHVFEEVAKLKKTVKRVLFYEVTKNAIQKAFENPRDLDEKKYDAQKSRRVLDRLVGYKISPILWYKVRQGLSAGRVQSVALLLICNREKEIREFIPQEYWTIKGIFEDPESRQVISKLEEIAGEKVDIKTKDKAEAITAEIKKRGFFLKNIVEKPKKKSAPIPFITSTLQQDAVRKLYFSTKKTMVIAQMLYEGLDLGPLGMQGVITYMRTDSPRISADAIDSVRKHIASKYGKEHLTEKPRQFSGKGTAQEAHECIRPTNMEMDPEAIKQYLTKDQYTLYKMIFDRFVACQMNDAMYNQTVYEITDDKEQKYLFRAKGLTLKYPGFMLVYLDEDDTPEQEKESEGKLPVLKEQTVLRLIEPAAEQNFTSPPPRYTEATLVKELEEDGIGRPSTYASIISTLLDKDYATLAEGKFHPTDLGCTVTDLLMKGFPEIINVDFTAKMESQLDKVEEGKSNWVKVLEDFYKTFTVALEYAKVNMENLRKKGIETDIKCELCGKPMVVKSKKNNEFLACSGYPDCKNIKNFEKDKTGKIVIVNTKTDKKCPQCEGTLVIRKGPYSKFLACDNYPKCKYTESIVSDVPCPNNCGGFVVERRTKKGRVFYGCSTYPKCNFLINQKPIKEQCPQCKSPFLVETTERRNPVIKCINKECGYKKVK